MAKLKTIYEKADEIPEGYADLYVERNGKMELTGIDGVKTQADIDRVQGALRNEKTEHKAAKDALLKFGDLNPDEVHSQLDELAETRARLDALTKEGKIDETKLEPIIEARLRAKIAPLERDKLLLTRQLAEAAKATEDAVKDRDGLRTTLTESSIERAIREAAVNSKLIPTAVEDAVAQGVRVFEVVDGGEIITRDGVGVTPGIRPADWLKDMQEKRPHWWPPSVGGGAGGGGRGGVVDRANNPWSKEGWNMTKQGTVIKTLGADKAKAMAEAVGSFIGSAHPAGKVKKKDR